MECMYYNYRAEFQMRGAVCIHGVLWVDLDELIKMTTPSSKEGHSSKQGSMQGSKQS